MVKDFRVSNKVFGASLTSKNYWGFSMANELHNTVWNNQNIYSDFADPTIATDLEMIQTHVAEISQKTHPLEVAIPSLDELTSNELKKLMPLAIELKQIELKVSVVLWSLSTFAQSTLSTDTINAAARKLANQVGVLSAKMQKALAPLNLFLLRANEDFIGEYLRDERVSDTAFPLQHARQTKDFLLGVKEEVLATGLAQDGLNAWGKLYNQICGTIKIDLDGKEIGYAEAASLLRQDNRERREKAYRGIHQAFTSHKASFTAILNAINGWRWEMNRTRSHTNELHYLDKSCHEARISRKTLDTLMSVTYENRGIGHNAINGMAKIMGLKQLGPWDLLAPIPSNDQSSGRVISFPQAIDIISNAFAKLSPDMAEFAHMMHKNGWIDGEPTPNRSPGAYCTGFANVREPRVFMTYNGSMGDVITLAHELGHAYHNWVMRDMPLPKSGYPMTLAETASIFAETLVKDDLLLKAKTPQEKQALLWQEAESASAMLVNIPSRFTFERDLVEKRSERELSFDELNDLMSENWKYWYGDTLSEYDSLFWATKLHFSISQLSFYNYPYLFGYLFSLGIYAKKDEYGDKFHELYKNILRDTGCMSAEALIQKHFKQDISEKEFWQGSLQMVARSVDAFTKS